MGHGDRAALFYADRDNGGPGDVAFRDLEEFIANADEIVVEVAAADLRPAWGTARWTDRGAADGHRGDIITELSERLW